MSPSHLPVPLTQNDPPVYDPRPGSSSVHQEETPVGAPELPFLPDTRSSLLAARERRVPWLASLSHACILSALNRTYAGHARTKRFANCGRDWWVMRSTTESDHYKLAVACCHDRFCVPCSAERAHRIKCNLRDHIARRPHKFLTLTLKSTANTLPFQLDRLYRAFRRLRSQSLWRERVRGGAAFCELTLNDQSQLWHLHLHVLLDADFIPQPYLKSAWLAATGDSDVVDIRLVRNWETVATYLSQYATKALPDNVLRTSPKLDELVLALRGRKLVYTFGTWRAFRLLAHASDKSWQRYASLDYLEQKAYDGNFLAAQLLDAARAIIALDPSLHFGISGNALAPTEPQALDPNVTLTTHPLANWPP